MSAGKAKLRAALVSEEISFAPEKENSNMDEMIRAIGEHEQRTGRPCFPFAYPRPRTQDMVIMGEFLCEIKAQLGHGNFIRWVEAECPFSYRTAHRYMRAARGYRRLFPKTDTVSDLTHVQAQ
jgi:hypothetical protein